MRTEIINIYTFEELPEETKQTVIENFRNDYSLCDHAIEEGINSLKAYCEHFGVTLQDYSIGIHSQPFVKTDAENYHFRGLKLKNCDREYMPTGFWLDFDFFSKFYDFFKDTGNALKAFKWGLSTGIDAIVRDCEAYFEDENIISMIEANEYEFLDNGDLA